MTTYRRTDKSDPWHWRADCPNYPKRHYEEISTDLRQADLCEQCRALVTDAAGKIRPVDETPTVIEHLETPEDTSRYTAEDWSNKAMAEYQKFNLEAALTALNKSLALDPAKSRTWYYKAMVLAEVESYAEAVISYDECLLRERLNYLAWLNRGELLAKMGSPAQALTNYCSALDLFPDDEMLWYRAAKLYAQVRNVPGRLATFSSAITLENRIKQLPERQVNFQWLQTDPDIRSLLDGE